MQLLLSLLFIVSIFHSADFLTCLYCNNVVAPKYCSTTIQCGPQQSCFSDNVLGPNGDNSYNLGCKDTQHCQANHPGSSGCSNCCSNDLCNLGLCGSSTLAPSSARGPICYTCTQHADPMSCHTIQQCGLAEVCSIFKDANTRLYRSACQSKQKCELIMGIFRDAIVGRRSGYSSELTPENTCVAKCCDDDLCTGDCGPRTALTTPVVDPCQGFNCTHGTCHSTNGTASCTCNVGYSGAHCDHDACYNHICTHGRCQISGTRAHCACDQGYIGAHCDQSDPCFGYACIHGNCHVSNGKAACSCSAGYLGANCGQVDPCHNFSCSHGICHSTSSRASCICNSGYIGTQCDQVDPCYGFACSRGFCTSANGKPYCNCYVGYKGTHCEVHDPCVGFHCVHGTCHSISGQAYCNCPDGYTGTYCDQDASPPCTGEWVRYNGHCYLVKYQIAATWYQGMSYCQLFGSRLAEVNDVGEFQWMLHSTIDSIQHDFWLGGQSNNITWTWNSGAPVMSWGWGPGEPDNTNQCLAVQRVIRGWVDANCFVQLPFVCEK